MAETTEYQTRLVCLGDGGVGKTAILKRFLFNTFCERHRPTVEDLHVRQFELGTMTLKVDFLDTAGDLQFPAMRRLSIATGQAYLLVYAVDSPDSFRAVQACFQEIRDQKPDFQDIPIVFVGNKCELPADRRRVSREDVAEWVFCELPRLRAKVLECSAKDNISVKDVFRAFLHLAKIPLPNDPLALRRQSSAHVTGRPSRLVNSLSPHRDEEATSSQKAKPRSRSLIRRSSKKSKMKEPPPPSGGDDGCSVA